MMEYIGKFGNFSFFGKRWCGFFLAAVFHHFPLNKCEWVTVCVHLCMLLSFAWVRVCVCVCVLCIYRRDSATPSSHASQKMYLFPLFFRGYLFAFATFVGVSVSLFCWSRFFGGGGQTQKELPSQKAGTWRNVSRTTLEWKGLNYVSLRWQAVNEQPSCSSRCICVLLECCLISFFFWVWKKSTGIGFWEFLTK